MLRLAGKEAAIVGVNAGLRAGALGRHAVVDLSPERMHEKIGWAYEGAARAGKSRDDVVLSMNCWLVRVAPDAASAAAFLDRIAAQFDITGDELGASPAVLVGTVDAICDKLEMCRREYGFRHIGLDAGFHPKNLDSIAPIVATLGEQ